MLEYIKFKMQANQSIESDFHSFGRAADGAVAATLSGQGNIGYG